MWAAQVRDAVPPDARTQDAKFRVHVIYTTPEATRAGLRVARRLAADLGAKLELLIAQVVPYPLPMDEAVPAAAFREEQLRALACECDGAVDVHVILCRDQEETIARWLPSHSIVIIGRQRRWGFGSSSRLIRSVRRSRPNVIVVDLRRSCLYGSS